ncbi:MAG: DUF2273 domain-containing protein [Firmicutes bacterium]|nr:DUF2273 domain-containing protein [Bacillota bacterium]
MDGRQDDLLAWLMANKGKILGTAAGILLGWLTLQYGFFKAVFLLLCLAVGYMVGASADHEGGLRNLVAGFFTSSRRR